MSDEKTLIDHIKQFRRFTYHGSPESDGGMTSPQGIQDVLNDYDAIPLPDSIQDSGVFDPSTITAGSDGTSTNTRTSTPGKDNVTTGRHPDCICEIPRQERHHVELTDEGLETGLYTTMTPETTRMAKDDSNTPIKPYDFSARISVDAGTYSRPIVARTLMARLPRLFRTRS